MALSSATSIKFQKLQKVISKYSFHKPQLYINVLILDNLLILLQNLTFHQKFFVETFEQ